MHIPVYILPTPTPCGTKNLIKLFTKNELFIVVKNFGLKPISFESPEIETNQVTTALNHARKHFPDNEVIIIKDTSVTLVEIDKIVEIIEQAISLNRNFYYDSYNDSYSYSDYSDNEHKIKKKKWDLFYMSKWLDRCDLYKEVTKKKCVTTIVKTYSPFGIQTIMFTPKGRDIVLGKTRMKNGNYFTPIRLPLGDQLNINIEERNINAIATTPNLFDFNIMLETKRIDSLKLSECRLGIEEENNNRGAIPLLWFLIVVVSIVLLAWIFYVFIAKYLGPDRTESITKTRKLA